MEEVQKIWLKPLEIKIKIFIFKFHLIEWMKAKKKTKNLNSELS